MNTYTPDGQFIIAADGKQYATDAAHPMPLPDGIDPIAEDNGFDAIFCHPDPQGNWTYGGAADEKTTHWLARRPFPTVPNPKTQRQLDDEAFLKWVGQLGIAIDCGSAWNAGVNYARHDMATGADGRWVMNDGGAK